MRTRLIYVPILLFGTRTILADTLTVPSDYPTIQDAINASVDGDEVVVESGTYSGPGNENITFGGRSILVRSAGGPGLAIIFHSSLNVFIFSSNESSSAILDGFTVRATNPNAIRIDNGSPMLRNLVVLAGVLGNSGGVVRIGGSGSRPVIENCIFRNTNNSSALTGAMVAVTTASPTFIRCTFESGYSQQFGGAVSIGAGSVGASALFSDCAFRDNRAPNGGAIYQSTNGLVSLINCTFLRNSANEDGGALFGFVGPLSLTNCLFAENTANRNGGAVRANGELFLQNSTLAQNTATTSGGGVYQASTSDRFRIYNAVLWENSPNQLAGPGLPDVRFSCIQNGAVGQGNLSTDPLFSNVTVEDYRLNSGSPCIDAGKNDLVPLDVTDLDGDSDVVEVVPHAIDGSARFSDDPSTNDCEQAPGLCGAVPVVDMGCFEFHGDQGCATTLDGDLDGDGDVDLADFSRFMDGFGESCP